MEGKITNFKGGRHTQVGNQMIVEIEGVNTKEEAAKLVGKKVVWTTSAKKEITGEVRNFHGNSGAVRVLFETGMPGQAVGGNVQIK